MKMGAWVRVGAIGVLLFIGFSNCTKAKLSTVPGPGTINNTSTIGNPMTPTVNKLVDSICAVVTACHAGVTMDSCQQGVLQTSGFSTPLGINSSLDVMSAIAAAEETGTIEGNESNTQSCTTQVKALNCSSIEVQNAYQGSLANPFEASPALFNINSCQQVYSPGINLEVPIELVDKGLASSTGTVTFARTRTSFNALDYDGTVTLQFEIVAKNLETQARTVSLIDSNGASVATITVPANVQNPTLYRTSFASSSSTNYRVQLAGTSPGGQLEVFAGRILVQQQNATRTRIFVPLTGGYAGDTWAQDDMNARVDWANFQSYLENNPHYFGMWRKNSSAFRDLDGPNPFTLEVLMSSGGNGNTSYAALYNVTTGQPVQDSEITATSTAMTLMTRDFSDSAANFTDTSEFGLRMRRTWQGGNGILYRSGLWIRLTNLSRAEVYYRHSTTIWQNTSNEKQYYYNLARVDTSLFSSTIRIYNDLTGFIWDNSSNPPCSAYSMDIGNVDSGQSGTAVPGSTVSFSSTTKTVRRSGALSLNSGNRFMMEVAPNPLINTCVIPQSVLVIAF